jgi:mRNA interferase MazF
MTPKCWSVWLANLDPVVGSEQGRTRPVLILSETKLNHILPVVNALPITSRKTNRRIYPNEALIPAGTAGLDLDSIVLCYQIRTLDKQRLIRALGTLSETTLRIEVVTALRFQLALTE